VKDMENALKVSNSYAKVINYRFLTPAEFDARNVHKSVTMRGTDENALIENFCHKNQPTNQGYE